MISFRQHLSRTIMTVVILVAAALLISFVVLEVVSFRRMIVDKFFPQAETIAINLKSSLIGNEIFQAQEVLRTMSGDPSIDGVYLFNRKHEPVAYYKRGLPIGSVQSDEDLFSPAQLNELLAQQRKQAIFKLRKLAIFMPVTEGDRLLGTIFIVGNLHAFYIQIFLLVATTVLISGGLTATGILYSRSMQRSISDPISRLAEKMRGIATAADYTEHVESPSNAEVEALVDGFNRMIRRIADHEQELEAINATLEEKVATRTAALNASLQEKELLLREVHHRVKNNLQVIVSLLSLQMKKVKDPEAVSALAASLGRTRSISLIHEKLYASRLAPDTEASGYLADLCGEIFRLHNVSPDRIRLHLELTPLHLDPDRLISLALLLNEVLINTFKHAFPAQGAGDVRVTLTATGDELRFSVRDNGIGIPEEFELQRLSSLGLRLTTTLARQLGGTFAMRRTEPGTEALLVCPLALSERPATPDREMHT